MVNIVAKNRSDSHCQQREYGKNGLCGTCVVYTELAFSLILIAVRHMKKTLIKIIIKIAMINILIPRIKRASVLLYKSFFH